MNNYQKGFSAVLLLAIVAIIIIAIIGYFAVAQNLWGEDETSENFTETIPFVSARDGATGMAVDAKYILDNKIYTAIELDAFLKEAMPGKYYYKVEAEGYKTMETWTVVPPLPDSDSERIVMVGLLGKESPPELTNSNLSQFIKPDMGLLVGYVTDKSGQPLEGVIVKSSTESTITSNRGFYALNVIISLSLSCEGVNVIFSKPEYITKNYLHAMSGSIAPNPQSIEEYNYDARMNVELLKGSGEYILDDKHKQCY